MSEDLNDKKAEVLQMADEDSVALEPEPSHDAVQISGLNIAEMRAAVVERVQGSLDLSGLLDGRKDEDSRGSVLDMRLDFASLSHQVIEMYERGFEKIVSIMDGQSQRMRQFEEVCNLKKDMAWVMNNDSSKGMKVLKLGRSNRAIAFFGVTPVDRTDLSTKDKLGVYYTRYTNRDVVNVVPYEYTDFWAGVALAGGITYIASRAKGKLPTKPTNAQFFRATYTSNLFMQGLLGLMNEPYRLEQYAFVKQNNLTKAADALNFLQQKNERKNFFASMEQTLPHEEALSDSERLARIRAYELGLVFVSIQKNDQDLFFDSYRQITEAWRTREWRKMHRKDTL